MATIKKTITGRTTGVQTKFYVTDSAPAKAATVRTKTEWQTAADAADTDANLIAKMTAWQAPQQSVETTEDNFYGQEVGESASGQPTWEPARVTIQVRHENAVHQKMIGLDDSDSYTIGKKLYLYVKTDTGTTDETPVFRCYEVEWSGFSEDIPLQEGMTAEATFAVQTRFITLSATANS